MPNEQESKEQEASEQQETAVTFASQAELDAVIQKRLGRANDAATSTILESLGADSIEAVKAAMKKATELEQAQMSEAEKATARVQELEEALTAAESATADALAAGELQRKQTVVSTAATLASFNDPADAYLFLDLSSLGDDDSVKAAIEKLADARPYLVKAETKTSYGSPLPKRNATKENKNGRNKPTMKSPVRL